MGKYVTLVLGVATMGVGLWGIHTSWPLLWKAVQVLLPVLFVLGGLLAVLVALGEIRDHLALRKMTAPPRSPSGSS